MKSLLPPPIRSLASAVLRCRALRAVLVLPLVAAAFSPGLRAQSAVPDRISYQGRVTNANGTLIGAGTPVSRSVIFRVWKSGTGKTSSDLLYSEQQSANITDGEFSVLIGAGARVTGSPLNFDESTKGNLAGAFDGQERYLGVTVDDGSTSTNDPELSPRQQIVTAAFAFRARFAESATTVGTGSNSTLTATTAGKIGIGTTSPASTLDVRGTTPVITVATASGSEGALYFGNDNHGVKRNFGSDSNSVGLFTLGGGSVYLSAGGPSKKDQFVLKEGGNVGIGTDNPGEKLDVAGKVKITAADATGALTVVGSETTTEKPAEIVFDRSGVTADSSSTPNRPAGYKAAVGVAPTRGMFFSVNGSDRMNISKDGNVGIGTTAPSQKLQIYGGGEVELGMQSADASSHNWTLSAGAGATGKFQIIDKTASATARMAIDASGKVGIGVASPSTKLHVEGTGDVEISVASTDVDTDTTTNTGDGRRWTLQSTGRGNTANVGKFQIIDRTGAAGRLTIDTSGNVGIGTTDPSKAKLQIAGNVTATSYFSDFKLVKHDNSDGKVYGATGQSSVNVKYSIYAEGAIIAPEFHAANITTTSDERIKVIKGRSDARVDLSTLMGIEITDYRLKDVVQGKDRPQKKIIAQQVEKLFPQAISRRTDVVPDIYQLATVEAGWIALATDLKKGDRVKLVTESEASVHEVMDVESGRFRTSLVLSEGAVFVYGREVSDFRMVDYEAIAMLNVSATQEIKREKDAEVAALREQNAALTTQVAALHQRLAEVNQSVAALDAKDRARDAKLASIEKLLSSSQTVMARPAATPRANASGQE